LYLDDIPEGAQISLSTFRTRMINIKDYAFAMSQKAMAQRDRSLRHQQVIFSQNTDDKVLHVHEDMYHRYLDGSGTVEALLGRATVESSDYTHDKLIARTLDYTAIWESYKAKATHAFNDDKLTRFKKIALSTFNTLLHKKDETGMLTDLELTHGINNEVIIKNESLARAEEIINTITLDDLSKLDMVCVRIICKSRFFFTTSEKQLTYANDARIGNEDISKADVKLYVLIKMISDYLASVIEPVEV